MKILPYIRTKNDTTNDAPQTTDRNTTVQRGINIGDIQEDHRALGKRIGDSFYGTIRRYALCIILYSTIPGY